MRSRGAAGFGFPVPLLAVAAIGGLRSAACILARPYLVAQAVVQVGEQEVGKRELRPDRLAPERLLDKPNCLLESLATVKVKLGKST